MKKPKEHKKKLTRIPTNLGISNRQSLEVALSKIREVKAVKTIRGYFCGKINVPSILVGAVFAFAMAIGEMSATLFIALPQNYTLAVAIYDNLGVRRFVQAGASALFLVILCVAAFLSMEKISEGSTGGSL